MKQAFLIVISALVLLAGFGGVMAADEPDIKKPLAPPGHPDHKHPNTGAQSATDPSAILFQFQTFYWTSVNENGESDGETFLFQPVLPLSKTNLFRPALGYVTTPSPGRTGGMNDLFLLDLFFFNTPDSTFGVGPVATIPTATDDALGSGKYQLGVSFVYLYKGFKKDLPGILCWNQWSVAGDNDRSDVNLFNFQIVWVHHNKWGYIGWTDILGAIDWEDDARVSFPVGLRFGKVFQAKHPVNLAVEPYYTFEQDRDDVYGIKFTANFIMPKWMKH